MQGLQLQWKTVMPGSLSVGLWLFLLFSFCGTWPWI